MSASPSALAGRRILITRPRAQAAELSDLLLAHGAQPIVFPTIEIAPLLDPGRLDQAVYGLGAYDWVIFTSVNGVAAVWDRLAALGLDSGAFGAVQVAAIGPATAQALAQRGVRAEFVPGEYVAEAIAAGIGAMQGQRVLLPRADIAREALASALRQRGATVDEVTAYRTLPAELDPQALAELRRGVAAITFTSSSTARNFVALLRGQGEAASPAAEDAPAGERLLSALEPAIIACIGPITAQSVRELGLPVDVLARQYTIAGLVTALEEFFRQRERTLKEE